MRHVRSWRRPAAITLFTAAVLLAPAAAAAEDRQTSTQAWSIDASYKGDVIGVASGGAKRGVRYLDNINIAGDLDLAKAFGWTGATVHANILSNLGGQPNDLAGSIGGVDNIEVQHHRVKLYEAWIEQGLGRAVSIKAGLYDLNSEFYQSDSAALLIAPPFGIGSELSATGPNGPAIFPSTALAARVKVSGARAYAEIAIINANAGTIGDDAGVDISGRQGALAIGEAGWTGSGKLAIGAWQYTKKQPGIIPPGVTPTPDDHPAYGFYMLGEHDLIGTEGEPGYLRGFVRLGLSEGKTTPFRGGWQAGLLLSTPFASRPASALSLGAGSSILSTHYRRGIAPDAVPLRRSETTLEATYSDELIKGVALQPDVQYVIHPSADRTIHNAVVIGLRVQVSWSSR